MHKRALFYIFIITVALFSFSSSVFAGTGTVLSSYKYAWSNNVGYINFENVIIGDFALSGYAWSKNSGWIKFNPAQGGVLNSNGNLSGHAWGEQLGWIDFDNVSIDISTGRFSGTATGALVGTLTFDCPSYCNVRTDWRPTCPTVANASTYNAYPTCGPATCNSGYTVSGGACIASGDGGGSGGGSNLSPSPESKLKPEKPKHVETYNYDLTIDPDQSGRYTKDADNGQIIVFVPSANVPSKTTFYIELEPLSSENYNLVLLDIQLINSVFYNVTAKDQNGNFIHSFSQLITITLPVSINLQTARNLGVYWLNETNNQWVLIPDAVFADNKVVFQVNHLTKFAIFGNIKEKTIPGETKKTLEDKKPKPSLPIGDKKPLPLEETLKETKVSTEKQGVQEDKSGLGQVIKKTDLSGWFLLILLLLLIAWWAYKKRKKEK